MAFKDWLEHLIQHETPGVSIIAYNFGLFETENGYSIYLTGSKEYDEDDADWAANNDFEPQAKYFELPPEWKESGWDAVQQKVVSQLSDFLDSPEAANSFLSKAEAITTGFDDGDLVRIR